jgi:hypothetical protein
MDKIDLRHEVVKFAIPGMDIRRRHAGSSCANLHGKRSNPATSCRKHAPAHSNGAVARLGMKSSHPLPDA